MSHEQSETTQLPDGSWVNVYGRTTPNAGKKLPSTQNYATMDQAVAAAKQRSHAYKGVNMPYDNTQSIPPEVLAAMLGLSEQDQEKEILRKQFALGSMLGERATERVPGNRSNWGGALTALSKGGQGYMAGTQLGGYNEGTKQGMDDRRKQRSVYMDWLTQNQRQQRPVGSPNTGQSMGMQGTQGGMSPQRLPYNPIEDPQY